MAYYLVTGAAGFIGSRLTEMLIEHGHAVTGVDNRANILANWADIHKAKRLFGWEPQMDLVRGMKLLMDRYRSERDWAKEVATP
jgi:nucleoside-diphosphate-sugar epimerase